MSVHNLYYDVPAKGQQGEHTGLKNSLICNNDVLRSTYYSTFSLLFGIPLAK